MDRAQHMLKTLIVEAIGNVTTASVSSLIAQLVDDMESMATLNRYTPFSSWYKGEHGQVYRRLRSTARTLQLTLKRSTESRDKALLPFAQEYYDQVSSRGGGSGHEISAAIKRWREAAQ